MKSNFGLVNGNDRRSIRTCQDGHQQQETQSSIGEIGGRLRMPEALPLNSQLNTLIRRRWERQCFKLIPECCVHSFVNLSLEVSVGCVQGMQHRYEFFPSVASRFSNRVTEGWRIAASRLT